MQSVLQRKPSTVHIRRQTTVHGVGTPTPSCCCPSTFFHEHSVHTVAGILLCMLIVVRNGAKNSSSLNSKQDVDCSVSPSSLAQLLPNAPPVPLSSLQGGLLLSLACRPSRFFILSRLAQRTSRVMVPGWCVMLNFSSARSWQ